ncbi:THAP domain-containing protein 5-like [Denticeps clupeoides]|uniref:THAP-type domain-containing protein n=1 Tax=Denticeps clupeoides TaxID=299321 RepID=A0AAY4B090_9TELE|nr:THAP domain-containing protein 5-like [Denticeps clupeoides]
MPKLCSAPGCSGDSGGAERKSFYKFPLHDPVRLQSWLKNVGRENWTPSRHQYLCHDHFLPSCFSLRRGVRRLDGDAVPTLFSRVTAPDGPLLGPSCSPRQKRRGAPDLEGRSKRRRPGARSQEAESSEVTCTPEPDCPGTTLSCSQTAGPPQGPECPVALILEGSGGSGEQNEVVVLQAPLDAPLPKVENMPEFGGEGAGVQLIAYFETIPNVLPSGPAAHVTSSPNTVLSSSLSSKPIASTVPITSKHDSVPLTLEGLEHSEQRRKELEEHRYHKTSRSKEQLEAIATELQKKVKVLQQRHRRHLDRLLGLESAVLQLRQSGLLNEERLQLLEQAYLQTSAAVTDAGETVAIVYEGDNAAFFCPQQPAEDERLEQIRLTKDN